MQELKTSVNYQVYVDGACLEGKTGYGFVLLYRNQVLAKCSGSIASGIWSESRQVGGELQAVMKALQWCDSHAVTGLRVFYDYEGICAWATGKWKAKIAITQEYVRFIQKSKTEIFWEKVQSHSDNPLNDIADQLAKNGCQGTTFYWHDQELYREVFGESKL